MKIKEIRDMAPTEIAAQMSESKEEILNLRIQQQSGQLENPSRLRNLRRGIAQMETILTEMASKAEAPAAK